MKNQYEVKPLPKQRIAELQKNPLYAEMLDKYGEENLINNYLVEMVILQEQKDIYAEDGTCLSVTRSYTGSHENHCYIGIEDVYNNTYNAYQKYVAAPINKLKSTLFSDVNMLGGVPLILDHQENMANKHGILMAESLKMVVMDNVMYLLGKVLLISPESKFKWLNGEWSEISPGILNAKIREISFVTVPAQMNSTSLSSGEPESVLPILEREDENDLIEPTHNEQIVHIEENSYKQKVEKLEADKRAIEAKYLTEKLISDGYIGSNKLSTVQEKLLNLSSGEANQFAGLIRKIGIKAPLQNKPKQIFIQGDETMNRAERFAQFQREYSDVYPKYNDLMNAFEQEEVNHQKMVNLSAGKGQIQIIPDQKEIEQSYMRSLLDGNVDLSEADKLKLGKLYGKFNLSSGETNGGGETQPDSTQLAEGKPKEPDTPLEAPKDKYEEKFKSIEMALKSLQDKFQCMSSGEPETKPKDMSSGEPENKPTDMSNGEPKDDKPEDSDDSKPASQGDDK